MREHINGYRILYVNGTQINGFGYALRYTLLLFVLLLLLLYNTWRVQRAHTMKQKPRKNFLADSSIALFFGRKQGFYIGFVRDRAQDVRKTTTKLNPLHWQVVGFIVVWVGAENWWPFGVLFAIQVIALGFGCAWWRIAGWLADA